MMSLKEEDAHPDLTGVPDDHLQILDDWCAHLGMLRRSGAHVCPDQTTSPDANQ